MGGAQDSRHVPPTRTPPSRRPPAPPTRPERALADDAFKPTRKWVAVVVGVVLLFGALSAYDVIRFGDKMPHKAVASGSASPRHTVLAGSSSGPTPSDTATASPSPTVSASPSISPSPTLPAVHELSVLSVAAFGPNGTSDGDNPSGASRVLAGGAKPWTSSWYATAAFGNLQAGTGLLLDMGRVVSVSSVRVQLGDSVGANVELRLGDTAGAAADLATAASAYDVGGIVHMSPESAVRARYVLIWFTKLPPDTAGTYQVNVYDVTVDGRK